MNIEIKRHGIIYGQDDHVRIFSKQNLFNAIRETGFNLKIIQSSSVCSIQESNYYGVNPSEDLIMAIK